MLKRILVASVIGIALFFGVAALQPDGFRVERSARVNAPPAAVFARVNDFHAWQAWSPWAKRDPAARSTFEGAPAGVGARFSWAGNSQVGVGSMTITESVPAGRIRIRLDFEEPMAATNTAEFTFVPDGSGTRVTWAMTGERNLMAKAMGLVISMDRMVGGDFEQGLASLKAAAEAGP